LKKQILKPGFSLYRYQGLGAFKAMGQLDSTWYSPTGGAELELHAAVLGRLLLLHGVALQVEFERQILKPVFHFIGYRLWV
jgi:hypothetical protein